MKKKSKKRRIKVNAWVLIGGHRVEAVFIVESPLICQGGCSRLQEESDRALASYIFHHELKSGFTVEPDYEETNQSN
jgi:hypothetical protein